MAAGMMMRAQTTAIGFRVFGRILLASVLCSVVLGPGSVQALNLTPPHGKHVPPFRPAPAAPGNTEPVTPCDRAAASPEDSQKVAEGVSVDTLDGAVAVTQCQDAVVLFPTVGRYYYQLGRGQQKLGNDAAALESFRRSADLGSLIGAFSAGVMERDGVGAEHNDEEANRLFKLCADKGDVDCLNSLAYQYQAGLGTKADPALALSLYKQAADGGLVEANVNLGFLYRDGEGVAQDYTEAARRFQIAADKGDAAGARNLALLYRDGLGVPKDEGKAIVLFQQAADHGDDDALIKIAFAYLSGAGVPHDEAKSVSYYQQAADRGNTDGMAGLAYAYSNGRGVAADGKMAAFWMIRALAAGNDYSYDQLTNHWGGWSLDMRVAVQSILRDRGLYNGRVTGALNRETLLAITRLAGK